MILDIKNISKSYKNKSVLKNFNLKIKKGEFVGVVGESGSGKSTLLSILATLDKPDSGKIFFENYDLVQLKQSKLASIRNNSFGFIFQNSNMLMHLNVKQNISLPFEYGDLIQQDIIDKKIFNLLNTVGLKGYEKQEVKLLSGGEQQRVAIARAFVKDPLIIFADEPTGNLDKKNSIQILNLLKQFVENENKTIVIVTHDPLVLEYCTKVIELQKL